MEMNEMYDLIKRSQSGDAAAREKLLEENGHLVQAVVRQFLECGVEADALYQLGCIGFLKAVDGFDPQSGTQFFTCAVPQIAGEIRQFLRQSTLSKSEPFEK